MENSNNKLQTLIANYIQEIDRNSTLETSQQEEITDHLYSESIALMKHALSVEEAFTIAKMRFGSGNEISNEYSKVNGLSMIFRIAQHTILGLLIWKFITFLCALPVYVYFFNNAMLGSYQTRILISLFTLIFVLFGLFRAAKNFDMTPLISSLSSKWYLSLILVFVWFLNKSLVFT